jgi:hypothetical protein
MVMHAWRKCAFLTLGAVLATSAVAKVSPQEAAKLGLEGTELTPFGAIRAGNADGSIPAWEGGIKTPPAGYKEGDWYVDPYADDKPLFTITAQNYEQYADKLSAGQVAMFKKYPATYKMHVYPSRRSASFPQWHYENSIYNATRAEWCNPPPGPNREKRCLASNTWKPGVFFPIPKDGAEVMWNHTFRFVGKWYTALAYGYNAFPDGTYAVQVKRDRFLMPLWIGPDAGGDPPLTGERFTRSGGAGLCASQEDIEPPRSAGTIFSACLYLQDTTFDAYLYVPGQRRVRKAPEIGFYDSPGTGSDGLRTGDSRWMFWLTGAEEWYDYAPIQRKEMFIPYNSYKLAQPGLTFNDIVMAGHNNPELKRYELHRVWVVEATLKPGFRHLSPHRFAYFDEDSWDGALGDMYDARGDLWRVSEEYLMNFYNVPLPYFWGDDHSDLISGRHSALNSFYNVGPKGVAAPPDFSAKGRPDPDIFTPAGLRKFGVR